MKKLIDLFLTFAKIGLFTFGGGYAMISLIENNCVERKKWISHDEMMNITVIAESTPGPIAINAATFVGYRQAKLLGAISATLGIVLPSFLIILLVSAVMKKLLKNKYVLAAVLYLSKPLFKKKVSPILLISISAILGIGLYAI